MSLIFFVTTLFDIDLMMCVICRDTHATSHQNMHVHYAENSPVSMRQAAAMARATTPAGSGQQPSTQDTPAADGARLEDLLAAQRAASTSSSSVAAVGGVSDPDHGPRRSLSRFGSFTASHNTSFASSVASSGTNFAGPTSRFKKFVAPPAHVNMGIFRSPIKRQAHGNRNKYNDSLDKLGWQPSAKPTNKYNERFQYPADIMLANRINRVFYGAGNVVAKAQPVSKK